MFRFARSYGNHMVLQMAPASARIWGYGSDGSTGTEVKLLVAGKEYTTAMQPGTGKGPKWQVDLDPITDPGPHKITVTNGDLSISITDVLFGDVWYCGGQHNMHFFLARIMNARDELDDILKYQDVRTFAVSLSSSNKPEEDYQSYRQGWQRPNTYDTGRYSAVCWLFGKYLYQKLKRPIGLIQSEAGMLNITAWMSSDALPSCAPDHQAKAKVDESWDSIFWNGMVHPLLPMNMKGIIWYGGENTAQYGDVNIYQNCLMALISDWRKKFNRQGQGSNQPWGIVQLAPHRNDPQRARGFPDVRWAQSFSHGFLPNPSMSDAFLAVTIDYPDFFSPHGSMLPRFKRVVSARLALGALGMVYGQQVGRIQGPVPTQIRQNGKSVNVIYDDAIASLTSRKKEGFELCCSTSQSITCEKRSQKSSWTATTITAVNNGTVALAVTCADGQYVTGIRYAWRESPCEFEKCAIYSQDPELPAPPYIKHGLLDER